MFDQREIEERVRVYVKSSHRKFVILGNFEFLLDFFKPEKLPQHNSLNRYIKIAGISQVVNACKFHNYERLSLNNTQVATVWYENKTPSDWSQFLVLSA